MLLSLIDSCAMSKANPGSVLTAQNISESRQAASTTSTFPKRTVWAEETCISCLPFYAAMIRDGYIIMKRNEREGRGLGAELSHIHRPDHFKSACYGPAMAVLACT